MSGRLMELCCGCPCSPTGVSPGGLTTRHCDGCRFDGAPDGEVRKNIANKEFVIVEDQCHVSVSLLSFC